MYLWSGSDSSLFDLELYHDMDTFILSFGRLGTSQSHLENTTWKSKKRSGYLGMP